MESHSSKVLSSSLAKTCPKKDFVSEITHLLDLETLSPKSRFSTEQQIKISENQEKIKNILRDAYNTVRDTQSKIIEKACQVKLLTERTETLKIELTSSNSHKNENKPDEKSTHSSLDSNSIESMLFFNRLLKAQESIDLLLMDSLFECLNTADLVEAIHTLDLDRSTFKQDPIIQCSIKESFPKRKILLHKSKSLNDLAETMRGMTILIFA